MDHLLDKIHISADPKKYNFLKQLSKKLGTDFIRDSLRKEANESHGHLSEVVQCYFKSHIIMDAVVKGLYSMSLPQNKHGKASAQVDVIPNLYLNTIRKYTMDVPFHLDQISKVIDKEKKSQSKLVEYNSLTENRIAEFCSKLCAYSGQNSVGNWKNSFKEAMQYFFSKAVLLDLESVSPKKLALDEMLSVYHMELNEGLTLLEKILSLFEEKLRFQSDLAEMYVLESQCLLLKTRVFELRVMDLAYSDRSLLALRIISSHLDAQKEKLLEEQERKSSNLEAYQVLGSQYEELVDSYRQLSENITQQKWAIEALSNAKNNS